MAEDGVQAYEDELLRRLAARLGTAAEGLDPGQRFSRLGLDSAAAAAFVAELAAAFERPLAPTAIWDHPTPAALARHLAGSAADPGRAEALAPAAGEPIAVVGLACRMPGADDPDAFWRLLADGTDAVTEIPAERWDAGAFYDPDPAAAGKACTRWGGFLNQVDRFDAAFFGISPREARHVDPQQRLMLELAWEGLEDAGVVPDELCGSRTGVFVGAMWNDYARLLEDLGGVSAHTATGQDLSVIAGRISYTFGLQGPSLVVSTACSSSLVAVHMACQSLRSGESSLALAGGVNLILVPHGTVAMSKFGGMAPDGRCKAFDARADGYVRGEGGGVVVLEPLARALARGHRIYCVLHGSATNNDGFSNGLTAPNPQAQEAVLRDAYANAGIAPEAVHYVETHGTGTLLGDRIEAGALGAVLGAGRKGQPPFDPPSIPPYDKGGRPRPSQPPLRLGSVKTNVGHLEAAAGIAGLIKVALALRHRRLPPSLHCEEPSPHIPFAALGLEVQSSFEEWPDPEEPAVAGVSAFGFGGTNCHVVAGAEASPAQLLPLSAASPEALAELARQVRAVAPAAGSLAGFCRRAAAELASERCRLAVVARSPTELGKRLDAFLTGEESPDVAAGEATDHKLVFVFSGNGSQWPGMGRELLREPVFRAAIARCDEIAEPFLGGARASPLVIRGDRGGIKPLLGLSLLEALAAGDAPVAEETAASQLALFAFQIALAELWRSWDVAPDAVVGHSGAEAAAAWCAGALSLADAISVVHHRSRLQSRTAGRGAMAVVDLPAAELQGLLAGRQVGIAAVNAPASTVVSGPTAELRGLLAELAERGVTHREVKVAIAGHSVQMEPLRDELTAALAGLRPWPAAVPLWSTVDASWIEGEKLDAGYWARNLRQPVLFLPALEGLRGAGCDRFLEISPHPILARPMAEGLAALGDDEGQALVLGSCERGEDARETMLRSLGRLYAGGWRLGGAPFAGDGTVAEPLPAALKPWRRSAAPAAAGEPPRPWLLPLSADHPEATKELAAAVRELVAARPELALEDLCSSAAVRRSHHPHRLAVLASSPAELAARLERFLTEPEAAGSWTGSREGGRGPRVVFVFPGQGGQWPGMGRRLFAAVPEFRRRLEECDAAFARYADFSLVDLILSGDEELLKRTAVVQPALVAFQIALAALWRAWGIEPAAVVGHSLGEIAAATVAGALSLADAARLICRRSEVLERHAGGGAMLATECSPEEAAELALPYRERVAVGVVNGPRSTVLSGDAGALGELAEELTGRGLFCRLVNVEYASHSPWIDTVRGELRTAVDELDPRPAAVPFYSTVTGEPLDGTALDAEYWLGNLRRPVLFGPALRRLIADRHGAFVELSPHPILSGVIADALDDLGPQGVVVSSTRRDHDDLESVLKALGQLYAAGLDVAWPRLFPRGGRFVRLPFYPWQRQRYWLDGPPAARRWAASPTAPEEKAAGNGSLVCEVRWREEPLPRPATFDPPSIPPYDKGGRPHPSQRGVAGRWLILADRGVLAPALASRLEARGATCQLVPDGDALAAALADGDGAVRGIVDLRALDLEEPSPEDPRPALSAAGWERVVDCVRTLTAAPRPPRLWLVTRGAQATAADEAVALAQAPLWGLGAVVATEHPELRASLVDLGSASAAEVEALGEEILADGRGQRIALRGAARRVAGLAPAAAAGELTPSAEGTYLITGGLGALGLVAARILVERGARHLLLVGRSGAGEGARKVIAELRARGARVLVERADVARIDQLRRALAAAERTMPPWKGVVHAAAANEAVRLEELGGKHFRAVLEPKIAGALNLHRLSLGRELELFVLFSSLSSLLGFPGQPGYATANAFLDALAHHRRARGLPALSINWAVWAGQGLAATEEARGLVRYLRRQGIASLEGEEGSEMMRRLLTRSAPAQLVVLPLDREAAADSHRLPALVAGLIDPGDGVGGAEPAVHLRRQLLDLPPGPRRRALLISFVRRQAAQILELEADQVGLHQPFKSLGMDSLMTLELRRRLTAATGAALAATVVFRKPTIAELVPYLAARMEIALDSAPAAPGRERAAPGIDVEKLLTEIEQLSEEQARRLLD